MNVADFVTKHGIKLNTTKIPFRTDGTGTEWHKDASPFRL